jgi:DNA-binding NarL/FixJ family response regulator
MMAGTADDEPFSAEEIQLAMLLSRGATKEAIARSLGIAPAETEVRIKRLLRKIRARDRNELLARLSKLH